LTRVGFIGTGRIGGPMVARLATAGHDVRVLVRRAEKRSTVEALGAQPVSTLDEVADSADTVIICVFTDEQVQQICLESDLLPAMKPGTVLVVHTTGSPVTAEAIAARADRHFIDVVDAPISGGPHDVAAGQVTLFVGGGDDAVAQICPVLSCYGDPILHVGATGAGQRVKLLNNLLFAAQIGLVAETIELGNRLGISESTLLQALPHGSGTSSALSKIAAAGSAETFINAVGDFIGKDVEVIRETLAELGSDLSPLDDIVNAGLPHKTSTLRRTK
jgi:3-hydroxyisobutyrate dehydrogenase-like beta-hydroxyacid dehydrogenase